MIKLHVRSSPADLICKAVHDPAWLAIAEVYPQQEVTEIDSLTYMPVHRGLQHIIRLVEDNLHGRYYD